MDDNKNRNNAFALLSKLSQVGLTMVACIVVSIFLGQWLDNRLGTSPWLLLVFIFLGIAAGFKSVYLLVKEMDRDA